jgi:hypothetical protein
VRQSKDKLFSLVTSKQQTIAQQQHGLLQVLRNQVDKSMLYISTNADTHNFLQNLFTQQVHGKIMTKKNIKNS